MKINSSGKKATTDAAVWILAALAAACGRSSVSAPSLSTETSNVSLRSPVEFSFESLDDRSVDAGTTRGMPTVLAFVTTASLPAQAQVGFLIAMARRDGDRVHYVIVALEGGDSRELVSLYKRALSIPFPVAIADDRTRAGLGGFGDVSNVPVTILLDRFGRLVSRVDGRVVKSGELRAAMRGL